MNIYQHLLVKFRKIIGGAGFRATYAADGFSVRKKFVPFKNDIEFNKAWKDTIKESDPYFGGKTPDIRWRCHTCIWAASNCLNIEGDFVEFGVHTGILSSMVLKTIDFEKSGKNFFLYDTFSGIPEETATPAEILHTKKMNDTIYATNTLEVAKRVFSPFKNIKFVQGLLPDTISSSGLGKIAFASIDLNSAITEISVANEIWSRMSSGAMIILDDYGFGGHEEQNEAWNKFAKSKGKTIFAVPTGQGILMR